jgi:cell division transport system permease protein
MHIGYLIREGISGVRRTPLASAVTVLTVTAALVLIGLVWLATMQLDAVVESLRKQVQLEAFLLPASEAPDMLRAQIAGVPGVEGVQYISPIDAATQIEVQTGERVTALLDSNPFPASFRITVSSHNADRVATARIAAAVESITGVDTVMYRQEFVDRIDAISETTRSVGLGAGAVALLLALVLTANTIRLAIYAKRALIRTLHLVGATATFIRIPFLLEGTLHGTIGALVACALLGLAVALARPFLPPSFAVTPSWIFYAGIAAAGVALGFIGSILAVLRFMRLARIA